MNIEIYTNVYSIMCMIVVDRWNIKGLSVGIDVCHWINQGLDDSHQMHKRVGINMHNRIDQRSNGSH